MKKKITKFIHYFIFYLGLEEIILIFAKYFMVPSWKIFPQSYMYSRDDVIIIKRRNIKFLINRSDFTQWQIYADYPELHYKSLKLLSKKGNIIDVGSNIGSFTLNAANQFFKNKSIYKIYSFEPYHKIYQVLKKNIKLNNKLEKFIKLEKYAISKKSFENYSIKIIKNNLGGNSLTKINKKKSSKNFATSISLDDYCFTNKIKNISFIKIDVEGMELDVLEGSKRIIKKL